ncbi:hypothetical protein QJS10_CPB21g01377 [Acorus calamus]|uniref:mannosyl-glycoprotein endo-beta-N-acetylglucosaminidase n=1 Tax=Acorus calamus TaxID=4465 RepID=A0AAV9C7K4_ACOCL|nr:hypothetical protein QJS10_CPB21g01377 [Acorus calamus]
MGIDGFGRGTYGGGEWNTHVALDVLKKDDVSAALFAPGWVYESKQGPDFETAQNRWWGLVEKSWGILRNYPKVLPFYSNFDQGRGYHVYIDGSQAANGPWNNISSQTLQPVLDYSQSTIKAFINFKDASYTGGGNITFEGNLNHNDTFKTKLFGGKVPLEDLTLHISYSVREDANSRLGLSLGFSKNSETKSILLASDVESIQDQLKTKSYMVINPMLVKRSSRDESNDQGWIIKETSIKMRGYTLTEINILSYMKGKNELHDSVLETGVRLQMRGLDVKDSSNYNASLGHISIRTSETNDVFPPASSWDVEASDISWTSSSQGTKNVNLKMVWKLKEGDNSSFVKYNIYVRKSAQQSEYLGVAKVETFYVSDLEVLPGISSLAFVVQVCSSDGTSQKLDVSPSYTLVVKG